MAIGTAQVNGHSGNGLVLSGVRHLEVTHIVPVLGIIAALDIHTDDMTIATVLATCHINLDETRDRLVESNLEVSGLEIRRVVIAMPEGIGIAIASILDMETLLWVGSIG